MSFIYFELHEVVKILVIGFRILHILKIFTGLEFRDLLNYRLGQHLLMFFAKYRLFFFFFEDSLK